MQLDAKVPGGPTAEKWSRFKKEQRLINPANKSKYHVLVVGSGLAGGSAAELATSLQQERPRYSRAIRTAGISLR